MDDYQRLVSQALENIEEIFPWDLEEKINDKNLILLDIREKNEFDFMHIKNSINVPRGILEGACCWNYNDTIPELVEARDKEIVVICKSGNRSALACLTMQNMGYNNIKSLKLGIKGWNDNDFISFDINNNTVNIDIADSWLNSPPTKKQLKL